LPPELARMIHQRRNLTTACTRRPISMPLMYVE
jgi:hypothetical protein